MTLEIVDFIPQGREHAISQRCLCEALHISRRELRALVFDARRHGAPICSSCDGKSGGYYLPQNVDECEAFLRMQGSRIRSARKAMRAVQKWSRNEVKKRGETVFLDET